ncbi:MAG: hypothetical protein DMG40_14470 [Acidobacteria bacterium]|nr:MAG: hypothetical protein DMG40_14470 [Acidobacteriota bacterium]
MVTALQIFVETARTAAIVNTGLRSMDGALAFFPGGICGIRGAASGGWRFRNNEHAKNEKKKECDKYEIPPPESLNGARRRGS